MNGLLSFPRGFGGGKKITIYRALGFTLVHKAKMNEKRRVVDITDIGGIIFKTSADKRKRSSPIWKTRSTTISERM